LERNQPLIITDAFDHWEALKSWNKEYFLDRFGDQELHVKLGKNGIFEGPAPREKWSDHRENALPDFVEKQLDFPELVMERPGPINLSVKEIFQMFQNKTRDPQDPNESWISAYVEYTPMKKAFEELKKEISEPGFEKDFFTQLELKHSNIWIGDGQTLGKLHFDQYENALAMVKGAKEVILFDPRNNHQLYETYIQEATFQVTKNHDSYQLVRRGLQESTSIVMSPVDILNPDYERFPLFGEAVPLRCRIERGEFLFLPSWWWHEVQSYPEKDEGINIAVNFWFRPFYEKEYPCQTCPLEFNPFYRHLL